VSRYGYAHYYEIARTAMSTNIWEFPVRDPGTVIG